MDTTTCIVGLVYKGVIYLGGDSAGVKGLDIVTRADPKVFKLEQGIEKMIIGYTSSFRMGQLLRFSLALPERPKTMDVYEYMVVKFIEAVRQCFKNGGFAQKIDGSESGGTFLVGYEGKLFIIHNDYQVGYHTYPYAACGCGEKYAMGSLRSTDGLIKNPETRLQMALETASEFSGGVRPPFVFESL
jgi:hypothetical protein